MNKFIFMMLILLCVPVCFAKSINPDVYSFTNPADAKRFDTLTKGFRCVVCQNQSLADSNAPLAKDLRQKIYEMVLAAKTNQEIETFLVDRYGDFVLFKPRFTSKTLVLWLFPLIGIASAFGLVFRFFIRPHFTSSY